MSRRRPCSYPECKVKNAMYGSKNAPTCVQHGRSIVIELTGPQADWVDWALTGPISEWDDPEALAYERDESVEEARLGMLARDLTELQRKDKDGFSSNTLFLPAWAGLDNDLICDLLNMLEDVAPDLEGSSDLMGFGLDDAILRHGRQVGLMVSGKRKAAALTVARKIRAAMQTEREA